MLVSATELLTLYISMELSAYPLYVAVALHRSRAVSGESSTKYMIQGMVASAVVALRAQLPLRAGRDRPTSATSPPSSPPCRSSPCSGWPCCWPSPASSSSSPSSPSTSGRRTPTRRRPTRWRPSSPRRRRWAAVAVLCRIVSLAMPQEDPAAARTVLMWMSVLAMTLGKPGGPAAGGLQAAPRVPAVAHGGYALIGVQTLDGTGLTSALVLRPRVRRRLLPLLPGGLRGRPRPGPGLHRLPGRAAPALAGAGGAAARGPAGPDRTAADGGLHRQVVPVLGGHRPGSVRPRPGGPPSTRRWPSTTTFWSCARPTSRRPGTRRPCAPAAPRWRRRPRPPWWCCHGSRARVVLGPFGGGGGGAVGVESAAGACTATFHRWTPSRFPNGWEAGFRGRTDGAAWLDRLPGVIRGLARRWSLTPGAPFEEASCSWGGALHPRRWTPAVAEGRLAAHGGPGRDRRPAALGRRSDGPGAGGRPRAERHAPRTLRAGHGPATSRRRSRTGSWQDC